MDQNVLNGSGPHEAGPVITMDLPPDPAGSHTSVVPSFLAELTRAMKAAAEQMRTHIDGDVAEDAAGEIDKARARGAIEADELRRLADEDIGGIDAWLTAEIERVRGEAARRTDERREELESHLAKHDSIIAAEVDGVEAAVAGYGSTLDTFFAELKEANDPAELARRAGSLPPPPDLEAVRGAARADAVAGFANAPSGADDRGERADETPAGESATPEPAESTVAGPAESSVAGPEESAALQPVDPAAPEPAVAATTADQPSDEGVGLGVMNPAAVEESESPEPTPGPVAAAEPEVAPAPEPVAAGSIATSTAAVRLFRSITDWAAQPSANGEHRSDEGS